MITFMALFNGKFDYKQVVSGYTHAIESTWETPTYPTWDWADWNCYGLLDYCTETHVCNRNFTQWFSLSGCCQPWSSILRSRNSVAMIYTISQEVTSWIPWLFTLHFGMVQMIKIDYVTMFDRRTPFCSVVKIPFGLIKSPLFAWPTPCLNAAGCCPAIALAVASRPNFFMSLATSWGATEAPGHKGPHKIGHAQH